MTGQDRRNEVVARAAELFDEFGYFQTSMDDIAGKCGLAKPTLYHYFKSKDEILFLIHEEFIDLLHARHEARLPTELTPSQLLLEIMVDIVSLMQTHRGHVRVFFEHRRELPPDHYASIQIKRDAYFEIVEGLVRHGVEDGEFVVADVRLATLGIFGMCNWAYTWFPAQGPKSPREVARALWLIVTRGLKPR